MSASDTTSGKQGRQGGYRPRRGFAQAGSLLAGQVRAAAGHKGFAEARVLTRWDEIVGPELAAAARPVRVSHPRTGLGGTLELLVEGARAPEVQAQVEVIRDRVNAAHGYRAITAIRLVQTAATGFAEAQVVFGRQGAVGPSPDSRPSGPDTQALAHIDAQTAVVADPALRALLQQLGHNIMTRSQTRTQT